MNLDETDVKIIQCLISDARLSYRKVSERTGVSPPTVLARVERLEKDGVIKSYSANLDHEKLGYDITAIIEITVTKGKILDIERQIAKFPNVCAAYDITGLTDMMVVAKFKNRKELSNFVKRDLSMAHVERTNTHFVLVTVKEQFSLLDS
jgi:DNA-binding Lrp family transcriptional regulator